MNNKLHRYLIPADFVPPDAKSVTICVGSRWKTSELNARNQLTVPRGANSLVIDEPPASDGQRAAGNGSQSRRNHSFGVYLQILKVKDVSDLPETGQIKYETMQGIGATYMSFHLLHDLKRYMAAHGFREIAPEQIK